MTRFGMCNEHFGDRSLEAGFETLASLGYDGVEVTPWTFTESVPGVTDAEIERVRDAAEATGLEIVGVPRVFWAEADYHLSREDEDLRDRTLSYLRDTVDLCGRLGGEVVVFGSPNQRSVPPGLTYERAWDRTVELFGHPTLVERLEATDVTLCMEPLSAPHTDFVTTADEGLEFVKAVDHPNVGLALDGFHLAAEAEPATTLLRRCGDVLAHFHADNTDGVGPRHGDLAYGPVVDALRDVGYDGYVSLEVHADILPLGDDPVEFDPDEVAADSIAFLRECFEADG